MLFCAHSVSITMLCAVVTKMKAKFPDLKTQVRLIISTVPAAMTEVCPGCYGTQNEANSGKEGF